MSHFLRVLFNQHDALMEGNYKKYSVKNSYAITYQVCHNELGDILAH